jgi:predicted nucleotidyltransferase component of viral defense system
MTSQPRDKSGRWAENHHSRPPVTRTDIHGLAETDRVQWQEHFGATQQQVEHDYAISRVLEALAPHSNQFVFYGGTALSRTFLEGMRLSEDIDLLTVGPRKPAAQTLDNALQVGLRPWFGVITADPPLTTVRRDTDACVYHVGESNIQIQLINGLNYTPWPKQATPIQQRYQGIPTIQLTTYTIEGFVGAKTTAWCDRNTPRDLYDLWGLTQLGAINPDAAAVYRQFGPTGHPPNTDIFPKRPPTDQEWADALDPLCIPKVNPDQAYEQVVGTWAQATRR